MWNMSKRWPWDDAAPLIWQESWVDYGSSPVLQKKMNKDNWYDLRMLRFAVFPPCSLTSAAIIPKK